ncbi:MAG: CDP-alcohol phosphatidyltransferase family protein [Candidatus Thorarchaeota archaeon]|nr:MAG: CDP-alcohol phosphatidyltransferase family protein [Candidatus Thorarchaeota archaeon]
MSPSRYRVRGVFRGAVNRVAAPLHSRGVQPNTVTYLTVLLAIVAMLTLVLMNSEPLYGLLVFLMGFFDGVDGAMARSSGIASRTGALTDSVLDKVSEFIVLAAIALAHPTSIVLGLSVSIWVLVCLTSWLLISYTRARAESLGVTDLDVGVGARSERLLTLVVFSLLSLILLGLVIVTLLGILTAAYRYHHYKGQIDGAP